MIAHTIVCVRVCFDYASSLYDRNVAKKRNLLVTVSADTRILENSALIDFIAIISSCIPLLSTYIRARAYECVCVCVNEASLLIQTVAEEEKKLVAAEVDLLPPERISHTHTHLIINIAIFLLFLIIACWHPIRTNSHPKSLFFPSVIFFCILLFQG